MLRRAREEAAEGDVVGAGLGRLDGEMAARVAGDADDPVGAEDAARLVVGRILLADMDAVAPVASARSGRSFMMKATSCCCAIGRSTSAARRIASSSTSFRRSCSEATSPASSASVKRSANATGSSAGGVMR